MIADDEVSADQTEKAEHNGSQTDTEGETRDKKWVPWRAALPEIEGIPMTIERMFHFLICTNLHILRDIQHYKQDFLFTK